ncbi:MAG: cytochrome c biogenesis protein CcsA [ANME-2 cluster archaeon]|nr:cytochrome c biogenesis protein CcsA [ANME-2 cluster archaeon]MBC2746053.1 cytochrome c biogenesis protein CcsA [ANME-2 cluster archaeon]
MTNLGTFLLNTTLLFSLLSILLLLYREYSGAKEITVSARWTIRISALLSVLTMLLLIYYFLSSDFRFTYVSQNSSTLLSTFYQLAATIAVQDGAMLFWTALVFLQILWISERYDTESRFFRRMLIIMLAVGALFTYVIAYKSSMYPFQTWFDLWGSQYNIPVDYAMSEGAGLRPILKDPIMAIHPPSQFVAYATTLIPFAAALSYMITSGVGKQWEKVQRQWIRFSWFSMSLTLILGGAWIYKLAQWGTLSGTGNIWAWDPYETTPFIVWMITTMYMHMAYKYRTGSEYEVLTPLFGTLTFISTLYAGWVARSGAVSSTHDVGALPSASIFFWSTILLLAVVLYLSFMKIKDAKDEEGGRGKLFTLSHMFDLTAIVFIVLSFICFFGITAPIYSKLVMDLNANPTDREFFNTLAYPFTMLLMFIIGVCLPYKPIVKKIGAQKYLIAAAVILLLSVILAFIVPGPEYYVINPSSPFFKSASGITQMLGSLSLLSYAPIFLFSLAAIVYRFVLDVKGTKDSKRLIKPAGITLIHLGTILLLLGVIVSQSFDVTYRMNYTDSELGEIQYVSTGVLDDYGNYKDYSDNPLGLELVLNNGDAIHTVSTGDRMVEGLTKNAFHINLYRDGKKISTGAALFWIELNDGDLDGTFERVEWTNIMDDEQLFKTYHVKYGGRIDDGYNFVIKEIPLISAVWIGSALMCIGVLLTFADQELFGVKENIKFKARPRTAPEAPAKKAGRKRMKPVPTKANAADKYEKMLMEELEAAKK